MKPNISVGVIRPSHVYVADIKGRLHAVDIDRLSTGALAEISAQTDADIVGGAVMTETAMLRIASSGPNVAYVAVGAIF